MLMEMTMILATLQGPEAFEMSFCMTSLKGVSGFPGGPVDENHPASARDMGLIPGLGRSHIPWSNKVCAPQLPSLSALGPWGRTREAPQECNLCSSVHRRGGGRGGQRPSTAKHKILIYFLY